MLRGVLEEYKRLLLGKREELMTSRHAHASLATLPRGAVGDLADQAAAQTEVKLELRLRQSNDHLLRAIREALERIATGNYGFCEACRRPIPRVRLKTVPWTRFCRDCKERPET